MGALLVNILRPYDSIFAFGSNTRLFSLLKVPNSGLELEQGWFYPISQKL